MLSISKLASPDYYLGASSSSGEPFEYYEADKGVGGLNPDPLLRHGKWLGAFGAKLGLAPGSPITSDAFEKIYYGLHPTTGDPIRADGKSVKQQQADAKERAELKQEFDRLKDEASILRKSFKERERAIGLAEGEATAEQSEELARAREEYHEARARCAEVEKDYNRCLQRSQRPGTDLVFSAPKTVSMQWAALRSSGKQEAASAIEDAHDQAVRETFERMQAEFVLTRKRDPDTSRRVLETVQGVIAAQWRHFDARPSESGRDPESGDRQLVVDPQLHDHINLFAPVEGADGEIYAAYTDYIRANVKALGAMYRARLSQNLAKAGYGIEREEQKNGLFFKLAGISKEQASAMSSRAADIESALAKGMSAHDAKLHSRKSKGPLSGTELMAAWGQAFEMLRIDPAQVMSSSAKEAIEAEAHAKADADGLSDKAREALVERELKARLPRHRNDAQIIDQLLEMEAHFSQADIRQMLWEDAQFLELEAGAPSLDELVEQRMRSIMSAPDLLKVYDPNDPKAEGNLLGHNRFGEPVFTSRKLRERENAFFGQTVVAMSESKGYGIDQAVAMDIVREIEARESKALGVDFKLRDFQLRATLQAACGEGQLAIQIAGAGLGKTTSAKFTKEILERHGRKVIGVAPSNKAAAGLGRELGIATSSIDMLVQQLSSGDAVLDAQTVVFVDEAGMASFDLMEKLFGFAQKSGAKLILTGDPEQLPAVARGNVLRKLTEMDKLANDPSTLLYLGKDLADWHYVSRQKDDWAKQASTFFSKGYIDEGLAEYDRRGFLKAAATKSDLIEDLAEAYMKDPSEAKEKIILASTNDHVRQLNKEVRSALKAQGKLHGSWIIENTGMEVSLLDRVIFKAKIKGKKARLDADVTKNEFGTVVSAKRLADGSIDFEIKLDTPALDGSVQTAKINSKSAELDHAFATTIHRSQGMTVDSVFAAASTFISKELFYVMASRHRKSLNLFMLDHEKSTIIANAAERIEKRHANELRAVAQMPQDSKENLGTSSTQFTAAMAVEKSKFEASVLDTLRAAEARLQHASTTSSYMPARMAIGAAAAAVKLATAGIQLLTTTRLQTKIANDPEETRQRDSDYNQSSKVFGLIAASKERLAQWSSGHEWVGHDSSFIYALDEATGKVKAWDMAFQDPGMIATAQAHSPFVSDLIARKAEISEQKAAKLRFTAREAALAWGLAPVDLDVDSSLNGRPALAIRALSGARSWQAMAQAMKEAGGHWDAGRNSWLFPLSNAKSLALLTGAGRQLGFEVEAPKTPAELAFEAAWRAIEGLGDARSAKAVELLKGPEDIFFAHDAVGSGVFASLFSESVNPRTKNKTRSAKGLIVHEDEMHVYIAIEGQNKEPNTRLLAVPRADIESLFLLPKEPLRGCSVEARFDASGRFDSMAVGSSPAAKVAATSTQGFGVAPAPETSRTHNSPVAPPPTQMPAASRWPLIDPQDTRAALASIQAVVKHTGLRDRSGTLNDHNFTYIKLEDYAPGSGRSKFQGHVLGTSPTHAFVLGTDRQVVLIPRSDPALAAKNDAELLDMVGWPHTFELIGKSAQALVLPEQIVAHAYSTPQPGQWKAKVVRADNSHVYLQPERERTVLKINRAQTNIQGITDRVWGAMAEMSMDIFIEFDAHGQVAYDPQSVSHSMAPLWTLHEELAPKYSTFPQPSPPSKLQPGAEHDRTKG